MQPEFDRYASQYENLLEDPLRGLFSSGRDSFFHVRKRDLILRYMKRQKLDSGQLSWLDLGCGKGELLKLLGASFRTAHGCDPSSGMLQEGVGLDIRHQSDPGQIPFPDGHFDFVSAVCVFHHVPVEARPALVQEVRRVLKPAGIFAIIEHNPYNPLTQWIVSRTPVDQDAVLLRAKQSRRLMEENGFDEVQTRYFLYSPEKVYRLAPTLEDHLEGLPLGGQYMATGKKRRVR
jgi:SAM-dependent methyltransferase